VMNDKESLMKYGAELLGFAIRKHDLKLIEKIYKRCMNYFKEDPNNAMFLSIISSQLPLLDKYHPEFVSKYSSETNMVIDSPFYNIRYESDDSHLSSYFLNPKIDNLVYRKYKQYQQEIIRKVFPKPEEAYIAKIIF